MCITLETGCRVTSTRGAAPVWLSNPHNITMSGSAGASKAKGKEPPLPVYLSFACSAFSACVAEAISLPLDTAKVRLQLQTKAAAPKYRGIFGTLTTLAKEEGMTSLWKGVGPGLQRQVVYGGLRLGLYDSVKALVTKGKEETFMRRVAAGITTSSVAIAVASPTDLVKVRMQAESKLAPGVPRRYPNSWKAYGIVVRQEGMLALWTGLGPNIVRNAVVSTTQLVAYDQIKQTLLQSGMFKDDVACHLASGLGAGFCSTVTGSPVDVIKSRMMGAAPGTYSGVLDAVIKTMRRDGPLAFYSGFTSNFARLGTWNTILWATLEQTKALVGKLRSRRAQQAAERQREG